MKVDLVECDECKKRVPRDELRLTWFVVELPQVMTRVMGPHMNLADQVDLCSLECLSAWTDSKLKRQAEMRKPAVWKGSE